MSCGAGLAESSGLKGEALPQHRRWRVTGILVLALLNGDVSRQVDVPSWPMQQECRDVTYVRRWLVEVDGA